MKKKIDWVNAINKLVFITLIISIVVVTSILIFAPSRQTEEFQRVKSDYVLMLLECILGIFAMLLPKFLKRKANLIIPSDMMLMYAIFLYCSIYLGEVRSFYYIVPHWDTILHTCSGVMLGALGFSFVMILNKTDRIPVQLSPIFVAVFAFCFAVSLGAIWEIYEFAADCIAHTNMQKYATEGMNLMIGQDALRDTMKDIIVDVIGAFFISMVGYISLKYKKGWLDGSLIRFKEEN